MPKNPAAGYALQWHAYNNTWCFCKNLWKPTGHSRCSHAHPFCLCGWLLAIEPTDIALGWQYERASVVCPARWLALRSQDSFERQCRRCKTGTTVGGRHQPDIRGCDLNDPVCGRLSYRQATTVMLMTVCWRQRCGYDHSWWRLATCDQRSSSRRWPVALRHFCCQWGTTMAVAARRG